jgi:small-conductance mechanosensitive channel
MTHCFPGQSDFIIVIRSWFLLLSLMMIPAFSLCQENADVDQTSLKSDHTLAPVKFEGDALFYVRGVSAFPAEERAVTIQHRILKAAKDRSIPPDSVKIMGGPNRLGVYAGSEFIMNVFPEDAEANDVNLTVMGEVIQQKIAATIQLYRDERSPALIRSAVWKGIVSFLIMVFTIFVFLWIYNRLKRFLKNRIHHKAELIAKISFKLIRPENLINALRGWSRVTRNIIVIAITLIGVNYMLSLFPWTKSVSTYVLELFLDPLKQAGTGFLNYLPEFGFLVVIIILARLVINLMKLFFTGLQNGAIVLHNFYPEWAMPAFQIFRFMIIILTVVMAFPYIPFSETGAFKGVSVFLGLLFSLGSSSFVSNVIAGYSLTFRRAFHLGDRILVNDIIGTVESQSLMVTRLRSTKNEEIVIPNSVLINSTVLNYTKKAQEPGVVLHTTVGIGYDTPWRQVEAMLKMAADRTEGLLKDPPPFVLQRALGDFAVTYELNVYCNEPHRILSYYSQLHAHIQDVFNEYQVQIMTPNYVLDPQEPKVVPKENWNIPPSSEESAPMKTTSFGNE